MAPATGEQCADRGKRSAVRVGDAVHDLVQGAVSTHRDDELRARRHRGRRQHAAVPGRACLHVIEGKTESAELVAQSRPEARGPSPARDGVDDGERARQARPPPIARRKSDMDGKRIMGLPRFSSPMVVCEPP